MLLLMGHETPAASRGEAAVNESRAKEPLCDENPGDSKKCVADSGLQEVFLPTIRLGSRRCCGSEGPDDVD